MVTLIILSAVVPMFSDSVNLNKTETREGNVVEMICQSEAKPNPKMYFQRQGYPERYVNGNQPVSVDTNCNSLLNCQAKLLSKQVFQRLFYFY